MSTSVMHNGHDAVQLLALRASYWLEEAADLHPEEQCRFDQLSERLAVACGDLGDKSGHFVDLSMVTGIAHALSEILAVMLDTAPYLSLVRARAH